MDEKNNNASCRIVTNDELVHHGIKGMRWGIRRYQNEDGSRTALGKRRRNDGEPRPSREERQITKAKAKTEAVKAKTETTKAKIELTKAKSALSDASTKQPKMSRAAKALQRLKDRTALAKAKGDLSKAKTDAAEASKKTSPMADRLKELKDQSEASRLEKEIAQNREATREANKSFGRKTLESIISTFGRQAATTFGTTLAAKGATKLMDMIGRDKEMDELKREVEKTKTLADIAKNKFDIDDSTKKLEALQKRGEDGTTNTPGPDKKKKGGDRTTDTPGSDKKKKGGDSTPDASDTPVAVDKLLGITRDSNKPLGRESAAGTTQDAISSVINRFDLEGYGNRGSKNSDRYREGYGNSGAKDETDTTKRVNGGDPNSKGLFSRFGSSRQKNGVDEAGKVGSLEDRAVEAQRARINADIAAGRNSIETLGQTSLSRKGRDDPALLKRVMSDFKRNSNDDPNTVPVKIDILGGTNGKQSSTQTVYPVPAQPRKKKKS